MRGRELIALKLPQMVEAQRREEEEDQDVACFTGFIGTHRPYQQPALAIIHNLQHVVEFALNAGRELLELSESSELEFFATFVSDGARVAGGVWVE